MHFCQDKCALYRCLDLGLCDESMREVCLSEGLLEAALPLLQPDAANGPFAELIDALTAMTHAEQPHHAMLARLAPAAILLYNR